MTDTPVQFTNISQSEFVYGSGFNQSSFLTFENDNGNIYAGFIHDRLR